MGENLRDSSQFTYSVCVGVLVFWCVVCGVWCVMGEGLVLWDTVLHNTLYTVHYIPIQYILIPYILIYQYTYIYTHRGSVDSKY
jgi:hypothetical protein